MKCNPLAVRGCIFGKNKEGILKVKRDFKLTQRENNLNAHQI
jgi:hypothetical protein